MDNNTQQQQQPPPPKKRSYAWILYLAIAVIFFWVILSSMGACSSNGIARKTFDDLRRDMGYVSAEDGFRMVETETDLGVIVDGTRYLKAPANKVLAVVQRGYDFYVLLESSTVGTQITKTTFMNNPTSQADYYFRYSSFPNLAAGLLTDQQEFIAEYAAKLTAAVDKGQITDTALKNTIASYNAKYQIATDDQEVPSSWFNFTNLLSVLSLAVLVFVGYLIFRSFSGRSGLSNMGKNRATHTMGGAIRFTDVAGIEEEKEEVQEIVQFLRNPKKFLDLGARIPKGVLLVGEPGTGKTLLAKAIAGEAGVHFFSISGSDFSEMLVGVGPSRMRDLFETAKLNAPAIIFIDEIDSIARMRGVGVSGVSDENEQTLNQLLVQMDGFTKSEGVIVIAATNRPDVLDQALLRPGRFDRQIIVQLPDVKGREQILKVHAKGKPLGTDVDLRRVAQVISGFTGADIENLLNEAAIIAAKNDKKKINMADITEGINKVLLGPQKRSRIITEDDKKITAYHEAGHAIVSRALQPKHVVQEVSIIPRGMAAGYTLTNDKDDESHHKSKKFLQTQLAVYMAGRVAELMFIGDICTGSSNDLKVATGLAERMVTMFGMSDKLGPLYYGKEEEMALRLYHAQNPNSEALQSLIDSEIKALIINAEKTAQEILKTNKAKVDTMSEVLLERETIYAEDIDQIMQGKNAKAVIAEMEKRNEQSREIEKKDAIEAELVILENKLMDIMSMAEAFVDAKLAEPEKLEKLKANMELARDVVRRGETLYQLPSIDNLDEYAKIIEAKKPAAKKVTTRKKKDDGKTNQPEAE